MDISHDHAGIIQHILNQSTVEAFIPYDILLLMLALFIAGLWMASLSLKRLRHNEEVRRKENVLLERQHEHDSKLIDELTAKIDELLTTNEDEVTPPP